MKKYKCNVCGNVVQVLFTGAGELVCCGQAMEHLIPQQDSDSELGEKHTPIIESDINGRYIRVKHHPMEENHYIQLIEAFAKDKSSLHIKYLRPKDVAEFNITAFEQEIDAQELCNIHGLWSDKQGEKND